MKKCRPAAARFLLIALSLTFFFGACTIHENRSAAGLHHRSFIAYWPPPKDNQQLCLKVKDNIDMKGVVTTAGSEYVAKTSSPDSQDAECLAIARKRNVRIVGKTNLSEFAVAPSGLNDYFGTPHNPYDKLAGIIPGGSSSGSAAAVSRGVADVAFGTDTAGSIRVPAACCGIVSLKTTFGLVSLKGCSRLSRSTWIRLDRWGKTWRTSCKEWTFCRKDSPPGTREPWLLSLQQNKSKLDGST